MKKFKIGEIRERLRALIYKNEKRLGNNKADLENTVTGEKIELKTDTYKNNILPVEFGTRVLKTMKFIYGGPRKAIADGCNYIIFEKLNPEGIYCGQLYFEPKDLKEFQYKNHQNYRRSKTKLGGTEATCNLIPIEDLEGLVVRKEPSLEWQVAYWFERLPLEYQAVIIYLFFDGKYLRPMEDWIKNLEDLIYDHGFETIWEFLYAVTP